MTTANDGWKVQLRSLEEIDRHNFMGLGDGEVDAISQAAVSKALAHKQAMGLSITVWNDGNPYRKYPDGRIECIEM